MTLSDLASPFTLTDVSEVDTLLASLPRLPVDDYRADPWFPRMSVMLSDAINWASKFTESVEREQAEVDKMIAQITRQYGLSASTPPQSQMEPHPDAPWPMVERARSIVLKAWAARCKLLKNGGHGYNEASTVKETETPTVKDICAWALRSAKEEGLTWQECMTWYESNAKA